MALNIWNLLAIIFAFLPLILTASIPGLKPAKTTMLAVDETPYALGEMTFNGSIHGVEVEMSGTAQAIYSRFIASYPDVVAKYNAEKDNGTLETSDNSFVKLDKRNKSQPPLCVPVAGQNWETCSTGTIGAGIDYLKRLGGGCGVGPRSCVRISCSWQAAIYLCNDNNYGIAPSCYYLATYAEDLINSCEQWNFYSREWWVGGQEFDTDGYNIIVRKDDC